MNSEIKTDYLKARKIINKNNNFNKVPTNIGIYNNSNFINDRDNTIKILNNKTININNIMNNNIKYHSLNSSFKAKNNSNNVRTKNRLNNYLYNTNSSNQIYRTLKERENLKVKFTKILFMNKFKESASFNKKIEKASLYASFNNCYLFQGIVNKSFPVFKKYKIYDKEPNNKKKINNLIYRNKQTSKHKYYKHNFNKELYTEIKNDDFKKYSFNSHKTIF